MGFHFLPARGIKGLVTKRLIPMGVCEGQKMLSRKDKLDCTEGSASVRSDTRFKRILGKIRTFAGSK